MAIYALGEQVPTIDPDAFVHPDAVVIGSVEIGPSSSVWPCAVLRGDYGPITVGEATSIQDGAVLHSTAGLVTDIGSSVVIGHLAHIEGATIADGALIGAGATVLHRARIGVGATVGAGAVITMDMDVPAGALAVGVPAIIKPGRSRPTDIERSAGLYVDNARRYRQTLRRLD